MAKRRPRSRTPGSPPVLTPTTKSWESTRNTWLQRTCDIPLERSRRELQLCFRRQLDRRSAPKVMRLQSRGSPKLRDFGTPGTKRPFGCHPRDESQSILYGVRWWLTPKPGVWCVKVSPSSPVAVPTPKGPEMSSYHFVWFHASPCEWISLSILPSPIPELQHAPLPF
jgi:hypothetical protein